MFYLDYSWDLSPGGIILDKELDVHKNLGWENGDYFQLIEVNGRKILRREDKLVNFIKGGSNAKHKIEFGDKSNG